MFSPFLARGHLLAAIDLETTGLSEGFHEIVQIAVVPVDTDLHPSRTIAPFVRYIRPQFPERANTEALAVNRLNLDWLLTNAPESTTVSRQFDDYIYSLGLPVGRGVIPLAHNWAFESGFLKAWLGIDHLQSLLSRRARDTMQYAGAILDRAEIAGQLAPFTGLSLKDLTDRFGIINPKPHDAEGDAISTIHLYRCLLHWDIWQQTCAMPCLPPAMPCLPPAEPAPFFLSAEISCQSPTPVVEPTYVWRA